MNLKDFVSQTLVDIMDGVKDAQARTSPGQVIPYVVKTFEAVEHGVSEIQTVMFQVSVRAEEKKGSEVRISVVTALVGGGVKGESSQSDGHTATLTFKVPVRFPVVEKPDSQGDEKG